MASTSPQAWHKTACNICYANCGIEVQLTEDGTSIGKVRGDKSHPDSKGYTCNKAARVGYYQNRKGRLTMPLRRAAGGSYEEIDWDTAISEISAKLRAIRDEHGGDKIFYYGGGNQGGHLAGAYSSAFAAAYGSKYRSGALAQEKTGLFWVNARLYGGAVHGELEHARTLLIIGKNPWHSNGMQRARIVLKEASKDPGRTLIVIDPRRTETAELADIHLAVRPGRDAWLLAALIATILQEGWASENWIAAHTTGFETIRDAFSNISVSAYAAFCGVPEDEIRAAARAIAQADSMASYEDLGLEMAPHSTLSSYLHLLLTPLTGNFGKPGGTNRLTCLLDVTRAVQNLGKLDEQGYERDYTASPVTGARIVAQLIPCNSIPDEILTAHPNRFRAMIVDSTNPVHSLADSPKMRAAMRALDLTVTLDVAFTETARESDYVLPTPSHYEKAEATFFNFSWPANVFYLRKPLLEPLPGTMDEAEIYARLVEASGVFDRKDLLDSLRAAAERGMDDFAMAFFAATSEDPRLMRYVSYVLYRTLGATLPRGSARAAVLWGLCLRYVMAHPADAAAAGFDDESPMAATNRMFRAMLASDTGIVFGVTRPEDSFARLPHPDRKIPLVIRELLDELEGLATLEDLTKTTEEFPFVLAAGERRAYTGNTNYRNPAWMKTKDTATLSIHPEDAERLGIADGGEVRLVTAAGTATTTARYADAMQRGTLSIPNGLGTDFPGEDGALNITGIAPNELTTISNKDKFVGTPHHKFVPARVEPI